MIKNEYTFSFFYSGKENNVSRNIRNLQSYISDCGEADSTGTNRQVTETATTQAEAQEMYASVEEHGQLMEKCKKQKEQRAEP